MIGFQVLWNRIVKITWFFLVKVKTFEQTFIQTPMMEYFATERLRCKTSQLAPSFQWLL